MISSGPETAIIRIFIQILTSADIAPENIRYALSGLHSIFDGRRLTRDWNETGLIMYAFSNSVSRHHSLRSRKDGPRDSLGGAL